MICFMKHVFIQLLMKQVTQVISVYVIEEL